MVISLFSIALNDTYLNCPRWHQTTSAVCSWPLASREVPVSKRFIPGQRVKIFDRFSQWNQHFFLVIEHPGWNLDVPWLGWCRSVCSVWIGKPAASFYCSYSRLPSFCLKSAARIISRVARESRLTSVMYVSLRGLTKKSEFPWGRISEMFVVKSMPSFESLKKKF